jgi:UDP-glucuronate 4-epimerase
MKILVTGAAGFIGFHLVKRLLQDGHNIVGLDNINGYYDVRFKYSRLKEIGISAEEIKYGNIIQSKTYKNYRFIKLNLEDYVALNKLFIADKFDVILNLAAQAGVRYSIENPHVYIQSNIVGFMNILECCRHNNIKHLIYASSSSVYGDSNKIPFKEEDRTDHPVSLYAATKKANELMAHTYSHLYQLRTTGLRFFTVYGPYGRPDMAPMLFANAILNGEPLKIFNNGDLNRDFTYIDDVIDGIIKVTNYTSQQLYNIFNIGRSKSINLMDFILIMENCIGKKAIMKMCEMQKGDVKTTYADTTLLLQAVNYNPTTSVETGIRQFIDWYLNFYLSENRQY